MWDFIKIWAKRFIAQVREKWYVGIGFFIWELLKDKILGEVNEMIGNRSGDIWEQVHIFLAWAGRQDIGGLSVWLFLIFIGILLFISWRDARNSRSSKHEDPPTNLLNKQLVVRFENNYSEAISEKDNQGYVRGLRTTYWIDIQASGGDFLGVEVMIIRMDLLSQLQGQKEQIIPLPSNQRLINKDGGEFVINIRANSTERINVVSFSDAETDSFRLETEPYQMLDGSWQNRNFPAFPENIYRLWLAVFSEGRFVRVIEGIVKMENGRPRVVFYV
ncbi:MAG: hypothetical protein AB7T38_16725 [Nitrospirales bacterium]